MSSLIRYAAAEDLMYEFSRFEALSFDCYGTLIDWEEGIGTALNRWAHRHGLHASVGTLVSMFSDIESGVQAGHAPALPYPEVLAETLREIGRRLDAPVDDQDTTVFGASVGEWPAFSDSPGALVRLASRFKLIIVSNVDRPSFAASQLRLGFEFDRIITASDVGAYKPAPPHFEALLAVLDDLGVDRKSLLHVAQSIYHDHEPAQSYGLPSVWIDRRAGRRGWGATPPPQGNGPLPDWRYGSMQEFADAAVPVRD